MRRDSYFQRKAAQQGFAERMNGLDVQPARRVQYLGEQSPGPGEGLFGGVVSGQFPQAILQPGFFQDRPFAQPLVEPVGHFRRRRPGEGEAQDPGRRRACQQQSHHPVDQHMGLAGAGVGPHPDRGGGVGGRALLGGFGAAAGIGLCGHSSSPAPADHSLTRARWS